MLPELATDHDLNPPYFNIRENEHENYRFLKHLMSGLQIMQRECSAAKYIDTLTVEHISIYLTKIKSLKPILIKDWILFCC